MDIKSGDRIKILCSDQFKHEHYITYYITDVEKPVKKGDEWVFTANCEKCNGMFIPMRVKANLIRHDIIAENIVNKYKINVDIEIAADKIAVDLDNDWDEGTTTWTFEDDSSITSDSGETSWNKGE